MTSPCLAPTAYPPHIDAPGEEAPVRYAIVPTHDRPGELLRLVGQLQEWCDHLVIIDNGEQMTISVDHPFPGMDMTVVRWEQQPPSLYTMWNIGFEEVHKLHMARYGAERVWDIAVLNDDTDLPAGWGEYVSCNLRAFGAAAASTYPFPTSSAAFHKVHHDGNIATRLCPWAFIVRGEIGLRADETFKWWWGDTDFDWQACEKGGVLLLPGPVPANTLANSTTVGVLAEQAGRDGQAFAAKWGRRPW